MMSREEYVAVNGHSNRYWGWGLEDDDMYHRIHAAHNSLTRLPQDVGAYFAAFHAREEPIKLWLTADFNRSKQYFENMQSPYVEHALNQLEADGLKQVCEYGDLIRVENVSRFLVIATFDVLAPHASPCVETAPNYTKLESEKRYRHNSKTINGGQGRCRLLLQEVAQDTHPCRAVRQVEGGRFRLRCSRGAP